MSKSIRVRIAVAVDEKGNWAAIGLGTMEPGPSWIHLDDLRAHFFDNHGLPAPSDDSSIRWVEAYVPLPEAITVEGEVKA